MHVLLYCLGTCSFSLAILLNMLAIRLEMLNLHILLPLLIFVVFPVMDSLWRCTFKNHTILLLARENTLTGGPVDIVPIATCASSIMINWLCLYCAAANTMNYAQLASLIFTMGLLNVSSVAASHELFHRLNKWQCWLGKLHLTCMTYTHFALEHVHGHHKHVATEHDPATAIKGQSLYQFVPQSITRQWSNTFARECKFLQMKNQHEWHPYYNRAILYAIINLAYTAAVYQLLGTRACIVQLVQSMVAIWLTETVNYFEHYGLERKKLASGKYEPVGHEHSWDDVPNFTNFALMNLPMHAHHHAHPTKHFISLHNFNTAKVLPFDYPVMIVLSFVPFLFRHYVHPILEKK